MARSKKQKHGKAQSTGRGVYIADGVNETIPRQAKTAERRHANRSKAEVKAARRH